MNNLTVHCKYDGGGPFFNNSDNTNTKTSVGMIQLLRTSRFYSY